MIRGPTSFILRMYDRWALQCLAFRHEAFVVFSGAQRISLGIKTALLFADAKFGTSMFRDQEINMQMEAQLPPVHEPHNSHSIRSYKRID
jgi:hypothetical protein